MGTTSIAQKIINWSVFSLLALLPFFFIPNAWIAIPQAKMFLVVLLVIVASISWVATLLTEGTLKLPRSLLLYAALLIPVAYLVSALVTGASHEAFIGGGTTQDTVVAVMIWYVLFVATAHVLAGGMDRITTTFKLLLASGAVVFLIQLLHLIFPSFTFGGALVGQAASVLGGWHDFGIFTGLMFFLSILLQSSAVAHQRLWRFFLYGLSVLSVAFLIIVNFSDVYAAIAVVSVVVAYYFWRAGSSSTDEITKSSSKKRLIVWVIILAASIGLYFGGNYIHDSLPTPIQVTRLEVRPSWQGTFEIGKQVFSQPGSVFFGSGPNSFPREWGMYKPLSVNTTEFWNVDFYTGVGFIPTSFVTIGLLGILAWGAVCVALLLSVLRILRRRAEGGMPSVVHVSIVASAAYLTAFHVLYVPGTTLSALTFIFFGALVAGELLSGMIRDRVIPLSVDTIKGGIGTGVLAVLALIVLFGGAQSLRAIASDTFVNRAVVIYNDSQDAERASHSIATALSIRSNNDRAHRAAVELGLIQFAALASQEDQSEEALAALRATLSETVQHGLDAVSIESDNYQNWLSLARLYGELAGAGVEGADDRARSAYEEVIKNNPTNPLPLVELAQLDIAAGDDATARESLAAAIEIKPNLAVALFLLSQIDARANDLSTAQGEAEAVVQLAPDDPLGWYNLGTIYYAQENYQNAGAAFERAVGIQNDYANAIYLLSASYAQLGMMEQAAAAMKAVAALNPDNESIAQMVASLESGENPFNPSVTDENDPVGTSNTSEE